MFETFYTDGLDGYAIQKFSNLSHTFCFEVETGHKKIKQTDFNLVEILKYHCSAFLTLNKKNLWGHFSFELLILSTVCYYRNS